MSKGINYWMYCFSLISPFILGIVIIITAYFPMGIFINSRLLLTYVNQSIIFSSIAAIIPIVVLIYIWPLFISEIKGLTKKEIKLIRRSIYAKNYMHIIASCLLAVSLTYIAYSFIPEDKMQVARLIKEGKRTKPSIFTINIVNENKIPLQFSRKHCVNLLKENEIDGYCDTPSPEWKCIRRGVYLLFNHIPAPRPDTSPTKDNSTKLLWASYTNNIEGVKKALLEGKDDLEGISNKYKHTALHLAASFNFIEIAKMLLDAGANIQAKDYEGDSPLHLAAIGGHIEMIELLVRNGASIEAKNHIDRSAIISAISYEKGNSISSLVSLGADINQPNNCRISPLMYAIDIPTLKFMRVLIENGADINFVGKFKQYQEYHIYLNEHHSIYSPLAFAIMNETYSSDNSEEIAIVAELLSIDDIDTSHKDIFGNTYLHIAAFSNAPYAAKTLVTKFGLDPNVKNSNGKSPIDIARERKYDIFNFLFN